MREETRRQLERIHFLTDPLNYQILRRLLDHEEPLSINKMAKSCDILKSKAERRLKKFLEYQLIDWHLDIPKYETQRITKSYTQTFVIKPSMRHRLNDFVDLVDGITGKPQLKAATHL